MNVLFVFFLNVLKHKHELSRLFYYFKLEGKIRKRKWLTYIRSKRYFFDLS